MIDATGTVDTPIGWDGMKVDECIRIRDALERHNSISRGSRLSLSYSMLL